MMSFQREQQLFVAALRDPAGAALPTGIEPRAMAIYQRLVYQNFESLLGRGLPICRQLLTASGQWRTLIEQLLRRPDLLDSPYFNQLSTALIRLLAEPATVATLGLPAYIGELAHYEWLELSAELADHDPPPAAALATLTDRQLLATPLRLCRSAQLGHYHWPVAMLGSAPEDNLQWLAVGPQREPETIAVYRDGSEKIRFIALNRLTSRLLQQLQRQPQRPLIEQLSALAAASAMPLEQLKPHAISLLRQFGDDRLVIATQTSRGEPDDHC
jgi:hypothetical protein